MGEYARSVAIAKAAAQRWPQIRVHFVLSAAAPYAMDTPFPATLLPSSPTFHVREVSALIRELNPAVVVFDNAGRTAQLDAARASGARVIFVSSRRRQRRKAFRLRWMRIIDEHWIAYPEFIAGSLSVLERLKLRLRGQPRVRFLDTVLPEPDERTAATLMARFDVKPGAYVLIVPGGGTSHPGAEHAPETFAATARLLAQRGYPTLFVGVTGIDVGSDTRLRIVPRLPMNELCELIRGAEVVISNGGDTLLQVLACQRPCIGVPVARDQAHRVKRCAEAGLIVAARLDAQEIVTAADELLRNDHARSELAVRNAQHGMSNAMDTVLAALGSLSGLA